jgi:SAM-dependent methyltransferase
VVLDVDALAAAYGANPGYLNVALRMGALQGRLRMVPAAEGGGVGYLGVGGAAEGWGGYAVGRRWMQEGGAIWSAVAEPWGGEAEEARRALVEEVRGAEEGRGRAHLEGALVTPWLVALGFSHGTRPIRSRADLERALAGWHPERRRAWEAVADALAWRTPAGDLTPAGAFFVERAAAYGVTASYRATLLWSEELIFGDGSHLWRTEPGEPEIHVDRTLNVWGSGGAHSAYFRYLDEVVVDLFNAPLSEQPAGICDMGCGNGALLLHLAYVIKSQTLRGQHLHTHPLQLVGVDFNREALVATAAHFADQGERGVFLWGDVGDPDRLALDLWDLHGLRLSDLLSVRSFLDHNRLYRAPESPADPRPPATTGAFAYRGTRLHPDAVALSLREHFARWAPYIRPHGLLVIELHTVRPEEGLALLGATPATAYDATHGFTDQYIVEIPVFDAQASAAGLHLDPRHSRTFPNRLPASVSLRYFIGPE